MQKKVIQDYVLCEPIGSGSFGKVYRGENQKTQEEVAIKMMSNQKFLEVPQLYQFIQNETSILSKISHPNIIKYHRMLKSQNNYYLIYEYCSNGTLEDLMKRQSRHILSEDRAIVFFKQIIAAFRVLVKENILHRDLKPSNILINAEGDIKVADFGFCKALCSRDEMTKTMVGSPIYMAPEILKGQKYTIKADIWSMGVCLFEMLFGYCPFEARNIAELINSIHSKPLKIPKNINLISSKTEQLLRSMLVIDTKKRIEWENLLNFFNEKTNENTSIHSKKPLQEISNLDLQSKIKEEIQAKLVNHNKFTNQSRKIYKNYSQNNLTYHQHHYHRPTIANHHQIYEKQQTQPYINTENNENIPPRRIATPNIPTRPISRYNSYKNLRNDEIPKVRQSSKGRIHNLFGDKFDLYQNYLNKAMLI